MRFVRGARRKGEKAMALERTSPRPSKRTLTTMPSRPSGNEDLLKIRRRVLSEMTPVPRRYKTIVQCVRLKGRMKDGGKYWSLEPL